MTKRFEYRYNCDEDGSEFEIIDTNKDEYYPMIETNETVVKALVNLLNELNNENEQLKKENQLLKEEKQLLKNKLDRIEDILPHFLSCAEISEFRGKTVKEDLALMKCWNKRGIKND